MTAFRKLLVPLILFCLAGLLRSGGMAAPQEPTDTPTTLITGLTDFVIVPQRIFTVFNPGCAPFLLQSPGEMELSPRLAQPDAPDTLVYQTIQRTAIQGAAARLIYRNLYDDACLNPADYPDIVSDITADEEYIYWLSRDMAGLVKISVDAQTFIDSPSLVATRPVLDSELVNVGEYIYQLNTGIGGTGLYRIHKVSGAVTPLLNSAQVGTTAYDFKTDGLYLYWRADAARVLKSYRLATGTFDDFLTSGLYSYFPVNGTSVYVGYQNEIRRYSIITGGMSTPLYTSSSTSWITSLAADASSNLYFIQQQVCTPACPGTYTLYRLPNGTSTAQTLFFPFVDPVQTLHNLQISDGYLFFIHTIGTTTSLKRIRTDADIVPLTNLRIIGMEINQSIQSDTNSVPLIQGKRTVARLLVQSDGGNIPGVFARLYRVDGSGATIAGPVYPINLDRSTTYLNVQSSPDRDNSSHSFLFFLPPDWVE
jgi:hypothetical protein